MKMNGDDAVVAVKCSPVKVLARRPIEVVAEDGSPEIVARQTPQQRAARPTVQQMMAAMRALLQQRAMCDEAEMVLRQIVSDNSPGSLSAHIRPD
jgi:hypothetical protein